MIVAIDVGMLKFRDMDVITLYARNPKNDNERTTTPNGYNRWVHMVYVLRKAIITRARVISGVVSAVSLLPPVHNLTFIYAHMVRSCPTYCTYRRPSNQLFLVIVIRALP